MRRLGYTIVEMVFVLIVVGILSVVAFAAINNAMRGIQLANAADKLASDLRYAKSIAESSGKWYGVSIEVSPVDQYTIYSTTGLATGDTIADNPAKPGSGFIVKVYTDFGVTISSVTIEGGKKVEFSPGGMPYTDRYAFGPLSSEGVVTLSKSGSTRGVRIVPGTGRVYIQ
jgi:Tfp pilus assembly protein FimT